MLPEKKTAIEDQPSRPIKEQLFNTVHQLTQTLPGLFGVCNSSNNWHDVICARTLVNTPNGHQYALLLEISINNDETKEQIRLSDNNLGRIIYRLDITRGSQAEQDYRTLLHLSSSSGFDQNSISRMLENYSLQYGPSVTNFSDNFSETEISADQVKKIIDTAQSFALPPLRPKEITLADFLQFSSQSIMHLT